MIRIIILAACFLLFAVGCYAQEHQYIRVSVAQEASSLNLKINGFYEIINSVDRKVLYRGKNLKTTVTVYKNGIFLTGKNFNADKLLITISDPKGTLSINGRKFRGDIQFIKKDNTRFLAINHIDLEDYLRGILYHEVSHYWPMEALKAQAIVCRSYAVYQMQENSLKDYDVTADIYSQVYGGRTSERYRSDKAVDETRGYVLIYQDKILPSYYHATCGGHTEDASLLWNIQVLPLEGVWCNFCKESPHFRWYKVLSQNQIKDALVKSGYGQCGDIKDIIILARDASGRITELRIVTEKKDIIISAKDFRNTAGSNIIRSTNFKVSMVNHEAVFEGFGWGHGVGLCQWGAYFMAKQGYTYRQILEYYYPGSGVKGGFLTG